MGGRIEPPFVFLGWPLIAECSFAATDGLPPETFTTLERCLVVRSDTPEILDYIRSVYRRLRCSAPAASQACDSGCILANTEGDEPWLAFNGEPVTYKEGEKPSTNFRLAFYGSSKLFRLSFRRNLNWRSLYAAAVRVEDRAVIIAAHSGIGKTTLALELMARGAGFYGDEFVFIRKSDGAVSGLPRTLMIRERTLSIVGNRRLTEICEASTPRSTHKGDRVWDNVDPADLFGENVFAQPAPLGVAVMLERGSSSTASVERVPAAVAAAECTNRLNTDATGFDRLTDAAVMFAGVPCYRVAARSPQSAADAVLSLLRGAPLPNR